MFNGMDANGTWTLQVLAAAALLITALLLRKRTGR